MKSKYSGPITVAYRRPIVIDKSDPRAQSPAELQQFVAKSGAEVISKTLFSQPMDLNDADGLYAPLDPVGPLLSNITSSSFTATWTAPPWDGGATILDYEYALEGPGMYNTGGAWLTNSNLLTVTVSGVPSNTIFTVYLRAVNAIGASQGTFASVKTLSV